MNRLQTLSAVVTAALLLAACGGDDGGAPAAPPQALNEVPQSALASADAFSRFVGSLPASETDEGLVLKDAEPPVSDTGKPMPVS
jgi:hypothetical protein